MLSSDTSEPYSYQITVDKVLLYERIMPAKTSLLFQSMRIEERTGDYHVQ